jgi:hypothetical protein
VDIDVAEERAACITQGVVLDSEIGSLMLVGSREMNVRHRNDPDLDQWEVGSKLVF